MSLYRCTILGTALGQAIQQRLWVETPGQPPSAGDAEEVANVVSGAWIAQICPVLSVAYQYQGTDAVSYEDPSLGFTRFSPAVGAIAGDTAPTFVTAKWRLITGRRGILGRTRIGVSPLSETQIANNTMNVTERSTMQTRVTAFLGAVNAFPDDKRLVAVSTTTGGFPRPEPLVAPVTSILVQSLLGSQVGRKA